MRYPTRTSNLPILVAIAFSSSVLPPRYLQLLASLLTTMLDATILKGIDFGNLCPTLDTKVFRLFTTIHHQGHPTNRPKDKEEASTGGPCFPGGCSGHTRSRFLLTVRALCHHHGKTRDRWVVGSESGKVVLIGGHGRRQAAAFPFRIQGSRRRRRCFIRNEGCNGDGFRRLHVPIVCNFGVLW